MSVGNVESSRAMTVPDAARENATGSAAKSTTAFLFVPSDSIRMVKYSAFFKLDIAANISFLAQSQSVSFEVHPVADVDDLAGLNRHRPAPEFVIIEHPSPWSAF